MPIHCSLSAYLLILIALAPFSHAGAQTLIYNKQFTDFTIPADLQDSKGWMNDAVIQIDDHIIIDDIDVGFTLKHTNVFDLQIFLQPPGQNSLLLNMYDVFKDFFIGADYTNTIFDDEAQIAIQDAKPPFTGRFKPKESKGLKTFYGNDAYGQWKLKIYDAYHYDTGALENFQLVITVVPEPATIVFLSFGMIPILTILAQRRRR